MNNFVFSQIGQDPLLYNTTMQQVPTDFDMRQRLDNALAQYQEMQKHYNEKQNQRTQVKDSVGELDELTKDLDENVILKLQNSVEYNQLNNEIQSLIQAELMNSVKWKINENPTAINKIDKMKDLIKDIKKEVALEEKKSMMELNDYLKNFSDMTFDDYKKLKAMTNHES